MHLCSELSSTKNYLFGCRAQAELDGLQEEQARMGELGVGISPLQAADLDRRKEKVAKLVKVGFPKPLYAYAYAYAAGHMCQGMRGLQEGEMEKHRIHGLILQADAKQQQVQENIAARPRGGARDELISELIQSRLAVSRAQMNAEASVSEQMIEEQQEVIAWLWRILEHAGMTQAQVTFPFVSGIDKTSRIEGCGVDVCCDVCSNSRQKPHHVHAVCLRHARNKC